MMKTLMICVVMVMAAGANAQDSGKVDPAKLDREKRRAEQALAAAKVENAAMAKEISRLKSELDKRNLDATALRDALLKKMNADEVMAKLSDIDLAKLVTSDPKIIEATKRAEAIQRAMKEQRLEVGMTVEQADKALNSPHTVASQTANSIIYQWKVYGEREVSVTGSQSRFGTGARATVPYLAAIYQATFSEGRLVSFRKAD